MTVVGDGSAPHAMPAHVQAVATISGPTDLVRLGNPFVSSLLGGPPQERADLARLASPLTFITPARPLPPFLIMHGTRDDQVPFHQAVLLYDALTGAGADVTLVPVEAGHNLLGSHDKETYEAVLLRFFHKRLYGACVM